MSLVGVRDSLRAAQWPAWVAAFSLKGARQECARELVRMIADAQRVAERLLVVEGDALANNPDRLS